METTSCYQITEAKLELMQKIINAHLTEEELEDLTSFAQELLNTRPPKNSPIFVAVSPATTAERAKQ